MSTGADCVFYEKPRGQWWYKLQRWPYGESPGYDKSGPFATYREAEKHLSDNEANPGGWSVQALPGCKHDLARSEKLAYADEIAWSCDRCGASGPEVEAAAKARQAARAQKHAIGPAPGSHAALLPGVLADYEQRARAARRGASLQLSPAEVAERKRHRRASKAQARRNERIRVEITNKAKAKLPPVPVTTFTPAKTTWGKPGSQAEAYKRIIMSGVDDDLEVHELVVKELGKGKAGPVAYAHWYRNWLLKHGHKPPRDK
jgi:hypothetical protein